MEKPEFQQIIEQTWKKSGAQPIARHLTPAERAQLAEETALTQLISSQPKTPVSTNFTALVLKEAQRKKTRHSKRSSWFKLPRIAFGFATIAIAAAVSLQYTSQKRASEIATVSSLATMPKMEWLRDYEAINRLNALTPDDRDVLLVLNQP